MVASSMFLMLLLPAFVITALLDGLPGPAVPHLPVNTELEALGVNLGSNQLEEVSLAVAELGKSPGIVPTRLETVVTKNQELELKADDGKKAPSLPLLTSLPENCGKNPRYERTGGKQDNAPWLILMGNGRGKDFSFSCIGVVISNRHVVSSALCIFVNEVDVVLAPIGDDVKLIEVLGISSVPDAEKPDDLLVGRNIVVITLKTPLTFSEHMQPACLPGLFATVNNDGRINNASVYGIMNNNGNLDKFDVDLNAYGPGAFYKILKAFNSKNPGEQVKTIEMVSTKHMGVLGKFKPLRKSVLILRNEEDGRFYLIGVGPVAFDLEEEVTLYTSTVPHRHWIEVVVRQ